MEIMSFSLYHSMRYTVSNCPIPGNANLDHLVRMVSIMFLHCKVNQKSVVRSM